MKIVVEFPPNFADVQKAFDLSDRHAIFCWGDTIYNPWNRLVPGHLIAHEDMHRQRQGSSPAMWWRDYLESPVFRLEEEIPAHRAELRQRAREDGDNRAARRRNLRLVAARLRNPIYKYNHLITLERAIELLDWDETERTTAARRREMEAGHE